MKGTFYFAVTIFVLGIFSTSCIPGNEPVKKKKVSVPQGWYLSWHNSGVSLTLAEEKKIAYSINFSRANDGVDAEYYLRVAEAVYPERSKIPGSSKLKSWYFERLWWFEEHKNFRIPFALTGDTVNYYIKKYKASKKKLQKSSKKEDTGEANRIEFAYSAKVLGVDKEAPSNQPVRVVLKMRWFEYCGIPCGWGFEKTREVYFDSKTRISRISGDGTVKKWVSQKSKPFQDDQWITF